MGGNFRAFFDLSLLAQKREALALVSVKARAHAHRTCAGLEKGRQLWPFTKPLQQAGD